MADLELDEILFRFLKALRVYLTINMIIFVLAMWKLAELGMSLAEYVNTLF